MPTTSKERLESKVRNYLYVRGRFEEAEKISYLYTYDDFCRLFGFADNEELCGFFDHVIEGGSGGDSGGRKACFLTNCVTGECRSFRSAKRFIESTGLYYRSSKDSFSRILKKGGCKIQIGGVWYLLSRNRHARNLPLCKNNMLNIRLAVKHDTGRDLKYLDKIVQHYGIYRDREGDRQNGVASLGEKVCRRLGIYYHPIDIEEGRERRPPRAATLTRVRDGMVTRYGSITSASIFLRSNTEVLKRLYRAGKTYPLWWNEYVITIED